MAFMGCYCYIIDPTGNLDNYLKQIRDFEKLLGSPPLESSDHMITNLYSNIFMFGMFSDILTTFKATSYTSEEEIVRLVRSGAITLNSSKPKPTTPYKYWCTCWNTRYDSYNFW
jgi:hypothetical protein